MPEYRNETDRLLATQGYVPASAAEIKEAKKAQEEANNARVMEIQAEVARLQATESERLYQRQRSAPCPYCSIQMEPFEDAGSVHTQVCPNCGFLASFRK